MRTVEASRFVRATPREVERALDPETLIRYEGTFDETASEDADGDTLVTARARSRLEATFLVEAHEDGFAYEQARGPFEHMTTELRYRAEDEGTRVTARSDVSLGLPVKAVSDRIAAWKRQGELKRALAALAADVE